MKSEIFHPNFSTGLCVPIGDSPAVPGSSEPEPREGRLHHVWLPEAAAHVPHGVPRHDQPGPLPRLVAGRFNSTHRGTRHDTKKQELCISDDV